MVPHRLWSGLPPVLAAPAVARLAERGAGTYSVFSLECGVVDRSESASATGIDALRPSPVGVRVSFQILGAADNEQQDDPEKTGFVLQTERHCAGLRSVVDSFGILPRRLDGHCGASVVTARAAVATEWRIPMKLTDTQLVLLSAAAQREDSAVEIGGKLKGSAAQKVLSKLLSEHLVE